jgi:predicted nucleic acid-binding protein
MNNVPQTLYYFDTNALLKYYNDEQGRLPLRRLVANSLQPILVSPLTLLEYHGVLMKSYRQRVLKRKKLNTLVDLLRRNTGVNHTHRPFQLVQLPEDAFRVAENILLQQASTFDIGANDALHLAIVKQLPLTPSPILVTSDRSMQHIGGRLGVAVYDPERE